MQTEIQTVRVIALYVCQERGQYTVPVAELELRSDYGIVGDQHAGKMRVSSNGQTLVNLRQFTAVAPQDLGVIADTLGVPYLDPAWLSANICLAGLERLTQTLVSGTLLLDASGQALMEIKGVVDPCLSAGQRVAHQYPLLELSPQLFPRYAHGRRGVHGVVLTDSTIRLHDTLSVVLPNA